ncbi:hypothetical protein Hamer_G008618 [Homarus americanus]|uniref:Uncharacterized protein n=1 Tax=Homarus americanus TaxID=6706 RepID=A0A8J5N5A5_HOMAM|nr:hypothetical protein Hamer_G008618 [Homarus americanus]
MNSTQRKPPPPTNPRHSSTEMKTRKFSGCSV